MIAQDPHLFETHAILRHDFHSIYAELDFIAFLLFIIFPGFTALMSLMAPLKVTLAWQIN